MKVFIDGDYAPWVTWPADLWKQSKNIGEKSKYFSIVTSFKDSDVVMFEWSPNIDWRANNDTKYLIFLDGGLTGAEIETFITACLPFHQNVLVLTDSIGIMQYFEGESIRCKRWNKPTRVPSRLIYNDVMDTSAKSGGFVITCNGQRKEDDLTEILRTYFAMCLKDSKETEGELELMQDVDIYSAQELPFEVFNNVHFHGLQPNPSMFKMIKNARLFISPYKGDGVPMNAIDAVMMGTPVLVRDTKVNRSIFNWNDECFYSNEQELAQKIKWFSDVSTVDPDYIRIVQDGFDAVSKTHSVSNSLNELIYIVREGV